MADPATSAGNAQGGGGGGGGAGDFIGALISLISRSEMRYQGFLSAIDPLAATIALEQVRGHGTEGRLAAQGKPEEEVPPHMNVFEFVTFRAADVKDLKIDDPHPNRYPQNQGFVDPAILGSSGPPHSYPHPPPNGPGPYGAPGQWGPPAPHPATFGGYGAGPYMPPPPPGGPFGGGPGPVQTGSQPGSAQQPAQQAAPALQQQQQQQRPQNTRAQQPSSPATSSKPIPTGPKAATARASTNGSSPTTASRAPADAPKGPKKSKSPKDVKNKAVPAAVSPEAAKAKATADTLTNSLSNLNVKDQAQTQASSSTSPNVSKSPRQANVSGGSAAAGPSSSAAIPAHLPARPQVPTPRSVPGAGGRTRPPPGHQSVFDAPRGSAAVEVPSSDFDFESSNAKFDKDKLDNERKSAAAAASSATDLDAVPPPAQETKSFYDKSSFFDNISSEVRERHEKVTSPGVGHRDSAVTSGFDAGPATTGGRGRGRGGRGGARQSRFEEEKRNLDTFGEAGTFNNGAHRGSYGGRGGRGRGRGRGRGAVRGAFS